MHHHSATLHYVKPWYLVQFLSKYASVYNCVLQIRPKCNVTGQLDLWKGAPNVSFRSPKHNFVRRLLRFHVLLLSSHKNSVFLAHSYYLFFYCVDRCWDAYKCRSAELTRFSPGYLCGRAHTNRATDVPSPAGLTCVSWARDLPLQKFEVLLLEGGVHR